MKNCTKTLVHRYYLCKIIKIMKNPLIIKHVERQSTFANVIHKLVSELLSNYMAATKSECEDQ